MRRLKVGFPASEREVLMRIIRFGWLNRWMERIKSTRTLCPWVLDRRGMKSDEMLSMTRTSQLISDDCWRVWVTVGRSKVKA